MLRTVSLAVFVILAVSTVGAALTVRHVVGDEEHRLLLERANEVVSVLSSAFAGIGPELAQLGGPTASTSPQNFATTARPMLAAGSPAYVAAQHGQGFEVIQAAGAAPGLGTTLVADRAALAERALTARSFVTAALKDGPRTRLLFAVRASVADSVVISETVIDPSRITASTPDTSFHELRGILYASSRPDPALVVVRTTPGNNLADPSVSRPVPVGADRWLVVVNARQPLVGFYAGLVPWIILGIGLLVALLAAMLVETLSRRRQFALELVEERTATLREREATLDAVFAACPDLISIIDGAGRLTEVSPAVERLLGYAPDRFVDGLMDELLEPDDRSVVADAMGHMLAGDADHLTVQYRVRREDSQTCHLEAQLATFRDAAGDPVGVVSVSRDITERSALERAQNEARLAAENANLAKSEFLSRMSHELRTPLNAILGFAQLFEIDELSADHRENMEQILRGGRHLLALINEVLDLSRIESGNLGLSPEPVNVADVVDETVAMVQSLAADRRLEVIVSAPPAGAAYVRADRQRLKQVLLNLASNAVKYNRDGGSIRFACAPAADGRVRIAVSDTGPGLTEEQIDRLFVPFERLGAEQTGVEGTGIGLALSLGLAEAMAGTLEVHSTPGQGATFTIDLPAAQDPLGAYADDHAGVRPAQVEPAAGGVLYIEDNPSNLRLVERILAQRGRVRLITSTQGKHGIELARQHRPDLILLDLHLPDLAGDKVLGQLRADPITADIPVVMLSADATPGQIDRLLAAGAQHYLTKPIDVAQLLALLDLSLAATRR